MRPVELALYRIPPTLRWIASLIWHIEHDFERARAEGRAVEDARKRIRFVLLLFVAGFLTLGFRATKAALFPALDKAEAYATIEGERADLTDRNGQLLAVDLPHYGLYFNPKENWDLDEVQRKLPTVLPQLAPDRLARALHAGRREYLMGALTPDEKARIDDLGLPGISFEDEVGRVYPQGVTAGHLVGFVDRGGAGLAGAELGLDAPIKAGAGHGEVALSVDLRVQAALQDELQKAAANFGVIGAVGIVTNVRTGEVLGMASYPSMDPNNAGTTPPADLINHAAATVYEPGSVFKMFTLAMGLDAHLANINTLFDARTPLTLGGQTIHDYDKDNAMLPLWEVFTHSSNIGAARLGLLAGGDRMQRYFSSFGLFAAAPSELKESARPITPRAMTDNVVASMAFGHAISVSPLALATGMGAILNGGNYIPLTIKKRDPAAPLPEHRVLAATTSSTMLYLMRLNATEGTGVKADAAAPGYRVGGKTGSAEKALGGHYERKKLVSSFAAVFPTDGGFDQDRYLVLIMMDEPHATKETFGFATGGWTAAPVAGKVIERIAPVLGVQRTAVSLADAQKTAADQAKLLGADH